MRQSIEDELALLKREANRLNYRISELERRLEREKLHNTKVYTADPFNVEAEIQVEDHILDEIDRDAGKVLGHKNLENNIGKNIMSIVASMLVFIGICGFIALVIQNSSDIVRIFTMYICSFAFYIVGMIRLRKHKDTLALSLTSCGIGAVYISLLITHFYFKMMGELMLGVTLVGWSVLAYMLAKKVKSDLFCTISYIGYTIAIILGTFVINDIKSSDYSHIVVIVLTFAFILFTLKICNDEGICSLKTKYIIYAISIITSLVLTDLLSGIHKASYIKYNYKMNTDPVPALTSLVSIDLLSGIHKANHIISTVDCIPALTIGYMLFRWLCHFKDRSKYQVTVGIIAGITFLLQTYALVVGMQHTVLEILIPFVLLGIQIAFERIDLDTQINQIYRYISVVIAFIIGIMSFEKSVLINAILAFVVLFRKYKYKEFDISQALAYLIVYTFAMYRMYAIHDAEWMHGLVLLPLWACIMYKMTEEYHLWHKIVLYFSILLGSIIVITENILIVDTDFGLAVMYITICALLMIVGLSGFATEWKDKYFMIKKDDSEYDILFYINHVIQYLCIGYGMILMGSANISSITLFIVVLSTFILCISDMHYVLDGRNDGVAILSELKYTLTTCYSISLYLPEDTGYILSIICIIIAIASIYFGFRIKFKGFRIYGLGLSLFGVFKLCLFDIYIDNPLVRVGSFILAGILCFIIVFIYSKLSESDDNECKS